MKAKHRRFLTYIILIIVLIWLGKLGITYISRFIDQHSKKELPMITTIVNETKISIQPIVVKPSKPIIFTIEFDSYQNPDILSIQPKDVFLLMDNGNPQSPSEWRLTSQSPHSFNGELIFDPIEPTHSIELIYFDLEEVKFEWTL